MGTYELAEHEGIEESMVANIQRARSEGAQVVLVYIHWGVEREYVPNEVQMQLGHAAIDAGADLVVGSHPHVIQGYEVYQGRYIVYSLGNFCFGGNSGPSDMDCMIFQQTFTVVDGQAQTDGAVNVIPCSISSESSYNNYQPTPAEGDEAERIMAKIEESSDAIAQMAASMTGQPADEAGTSDAGRGGAGRNDRVRGRRGRILCGRRIVRSLRRGFARLDPCARLASCEKTATRAPSWENPATARESLKGHVHVGTF